MPPNEKGMFDENPEQQAQIAEDLSAPESKEVSIPVPKGMEEVLPGDKIKLDATVVSNADGELTVTIG